MVNSGHRNHWLFITLVFILAHAERVYNEFVFLVELLYPRSDRALVPYQTGSTHHSPRNLKNRSFGWWCIFELLLIFDLFLSQAVFSLRFFLSHHHPNQRSLSGSLASHIFSCQRTESLCFPATRESYQK